MKYCSKCGNELLDEAVICPKCGCPVANLDSNAALDNRKARLKSAVTLNAVAFIINILCGAIMAWANLKPSNSSRPTGGVSFDIDITAGNRSSGGVDPAWAVAWVAMVLLIFALGIIINKQYQNKSSSMLGYLYVVLAVINIVVLYLTCPNLLLVMVCGIGVLFFVPSILQVIAGIRFLQCNQ